MIYGLFAIAFLLLVYAPQLWVRYVLWRYSKSIKGLPGTGGELAKHLIERFQLEGVEVEKGEPGQDHYSPTEKKIRLSPNYFDGKSLTAVAIAAHEVGHAIQFVLDEPVSHLRKKYMGQAIFIRRIGATVISIAPIILAIVKLPHIALLIAAVGILTMFVSVMMYVAILPEEFDASFNKALPILSEGYIDEKQLPAARKILKAAAYTYVAGALADVLSLWRWFRVFP